MPRSGKNKPQPKAAKWKQNPTQSNQQNQKKQANQKKNPFSQKPKEPNRAVVAKTVRRDRFLGSQNMKLDNAVAAGVIKKSIETSKKEMKALAGVLLPYDCEVPRILTGAQHQVIMPVATAKNFKIENFDLSTYNEDLFINRCPTVGSLGSGKSLWPLVKSSLTIVQFHDSVLHAIYPMIYPSSFPSVYSSTFLINAQCGETANTLTMSPTPAPTLLDLYIQPSALVYTSGTKKYGDIIQCWQFDPQRRCFWVDANNSFGGATLFFGFKCDPNTTIHPGGLTVHLCRWTNSLSDQPYATVVTGDVAPSGDGLAEFDVKESGYYYFKISGILTPTVEAVSTGISVTLGYENDLYMISHHLLNENLNLNSYGEKRACDVKRAQAVGCSLLMTNTTAGAYRSGTVTARVLQNEDLWWDFTGVGTEEITSAASPLIYTNKWETGCYSVTFPNQLRYSDVARYERKRTYNMSNPLTTTDLNYNGFVGANLIRVEVGATSAAAGAISAKFTFCVGYSFITDTQMFNLKMPDVAPEVWEKASFQLARLQRFHENPWHWSDITSAIKKAAGWVSDVGKKIISAAPTATKLVGMGVDAAELLASAL